MFKIFTMHFALPMEHFAMLHKKFIHLMVH